MVEGLLVLFGVTSYVCIAKLVTDRQWYLNEADRFVSFVWYTIFGWVIAPFWLVYKFWAWLLFDLPTYFRSRKK